LVAAPLRAASLRASGLLAAAAFRSASLRFRRASSASVTVRSSPGRPLASARRSPSPAGPDGDGIPVVVYYGFDLKEDMLILLLPAAQNPEEDPNERIAGHGFSQK
jgi:hypothetical protein